MKKYSWWHNAKNALGSFTLTQLMLALASIPILVGWGLGLSYMNVVGNLIFTPFLVVFLLLCSLLFFAEIFHIPNGFIAALLNSFTHIWDYLLHFGSPCWLVTVAKPPIIILIIIFVMTVFVLFGRFFITVWERLLGLAAIACCCVVFFSFFQLYKNTISDVFRFNEKIYGIKLAHSSNIILIDAGYFSRKKSPQKMLEFELKPWLTKRYGSVFISELRFINLNKGNVAAIKALAHHWRIQSVWFEKPFPKNKKIQPLVSQLHFFCNGNNIRVI